jgi:hypothetical protein
MSNPLKTYRICCYDACHKILTADFLDASDDEDAIARAQHRGFGSTCEIWDGSRLVALLSEDQRRQA